MELFKNYKNLKKRKINDSNSDDEGCAENSTELIYNTYNPLYFSGAITPKSSFLLCKNLRILENFLKIEAIEKSITPEIYLHITTDGGCITSAFSIIDCMEGLKIPVNTVIDGNVSSAGTLISIHGKKRFVCKNSYVLIHELRSGCWGKLAYIDDTYKNCIKIQEHINNFYLSKTNITKKMLKDLLVKDLELNAEECIKMGIVDNIYEG